MRRYTLTVGPTASGAASATTPKLRGKLHSIRYIKPGSASYADTVDFDVTNDTTGEKVWDQDNVTASVIVRPRPAVHTPAGVARVYAGTDGVSDYYEFAGDTLTVAVANAGDAKTGTFEILVD